MTATICAICEQSFDLPDGIQGDKAICPHCQCETPISPAAKPSRIGAIPETFRQNAIAGLDPRNVAIAIRCPYCQSTDIAPPEKKFTTGAIVCFVAGILLAPVLVGILLIIVAFGMTETKHQCYQCQKVF